MTVAAVNAIVARMMLWLNCTGLLAGNILARKYGGRASARIRKSQSRQKKSQKTG